MVSPEWGPAQGRTAALFLSGVLCSVAHLCCWVVVCVCFLFSNLKPSVPCVSYGANVAVS